MPITCTKCNAQNRNSARFCTECAEPLVDKIQCPFCGTECPPQASFCMHCATPLRGGTTPQTGLLPQNTILQNRYSIIGRVGHGGMGAVYEAQDARIIGKRWAVKELSDSALSTPKEKQDAIESFRQEAQMLALLDHPNLPVVSDFFSEGGKHYLVMEFIDGQTLEDRLFDLTDFLDEEQVLAWMEQICAVLVYLHSQSPPVIFRDLKPGNVMIDRHGRVKLIDFGIARLFKSGKSSDTQAMGTPGYAAPEQFGKGQTDSRSDIYSCGVMLYQLITRYDPGHTPFNLPPPQSINPGISERVARVIQKAIQPSPLDRYQDVGEMREALKASPQSTEPILQPIPSHQVLQGVSISPSEGTTDQVQSIAASQSQRSWWIAVLAHLMFGFGLFFVDRRVRRKWLYPFLVLCGILLYLDYNFWFILTDSYVDWDIIRLAFYVTGGLYFLSFIDVILTSHRISRGSKAIPDDLSWWRALGSHFLGGFGLAYMDSSLKRKWLYPFLYFLIVYIILDFNVFYVIRDILDSESLEIIFVISIIYSLSFIDLTFTYRSRKKTKP